MPHLVNATIFHVGHSCRDSKPEVSAFFKGRLDGAQTHPIPVDFSGLVNKIDVMGTGKMARWVNTCHTSVRTGVQIPSTHANAGWAWSSACNSSSQKADMEFLV